MKEGRRLKKSQPLQPVGKEEESNWQNTAVRLQRIIDKQKAELAALKSKPSEEEIEKAADYHKKLFSQNTADQLAYKVGFATAIQWLSSYKGNKK